MNDDAWDAVVASLRQGGDVEEMVAAAKRLEREVTLADLPRLLVLLDDPSFVVREAAAFPLAYLVGPKSLRDLLGAELRGTREGLDNDTVDAAIAEVLALDKGGARAELTTLSRDSNPAVALAAQGWLERL